MKTNFGKTIELGKQIPYQTPVKLISTTNANICNVRFLKGQEVKTMYGLWSAIEKNPNNFSYTGEQKVFLSAVAHKDPATKQYVFKDVGTKKAELMNEKIQELEKKVLEKETKESVESKESESVESVDTESEPKPIARSRKK